MYVSCTQGNYVCFSVLAQAYHIHVCAYSHCLSVHLKAPWHLSQREVVSFSGPHPHNCGCRCTRSVCLYTVHVDKSTHGQHAVTTTSMSTNKVMFGSCFGFSFTYLGRKSFTVSKRGAVVCDEAILLLDSKRKAKPSQF